MIPYYVVDAFADAPFQGNPAGVCIVESWPDDATMLARVVAGYAVTHLAGAPAYINSILKAGTSDQLHTLQTVVCNAETCPTSTTDLLHEKVPSATAIAIPTIGMGQ